MYKLIVSPHAQKELKKIKKIYERAISAALEDIREDPYISKPLIEELIGKYTYKVGVYRIIYKINNKDKIVNILTAGHRARVYQ